MVTSLISSPLVPGQESQTFAVQILRNGILKLGLETQIDLAKYQGLDLVAPFGGPDLESIFRANFKWRPFCEPVLQGLDSERTDFMGQILCTICGLNF